MLYPQVSAFISVIDRQVDTISMGVIWSSTLPTPDCLSLNKEIVRAQAKAAGQTFKPANEHLYAGIRGTCQF